MAVSLFRIGAPRARGEGLRLGTVRFLPRGVPKDEYATRDLFDVWLPILAPSRELLKGFSPGEATEKALARLFSRFRAELERTDARQVLEALAHLSHEADFGIGCYCENPARCHRSVLFEALAGHGAKLRR
jgi:uncharacterized protein YeaO (DUF488 family)